MMKKTRDAYLRKRLIRLLTNQCIELKQGSPEGVTVAPEHRADVRADIQRVIKTIEFEDAPLKGVNESFIRLALRASYTHIESQRATIQIVMAIVDDMRSDEAGHAKSEYTLDMFRISWVSRSTLKQRRMRQRRLRQRRYVV